MLAAQYRHTIQTDNNTDKQQTKVTMWLLNNSVVLIMVFTLIMDLAEVAMQLLLVLATMMMAVQ